MIKLLSFLINPTFITVICITVILGWAGAFVSWIAFHELPVFYYRLFIVLSIVALAQIFSVIYLIFKSTK